VALLQEVVAIPDLIADPYDCRIEKAQSKRGTLQNRSIDGK
jgi:hypothetical protein